MILVQRDPKCSRRNAMKVLSERNVLLGTLEGNTPAVTLQCFFLILSKNSGSRAVDFAEVASRDPPNAEEVKVGCPYPSPRGET